MLSVVRALYDININLRWLGKVALELRPQAKANEGRQRAMCDRRGKTELNVAVVTPIIDLDVILVDDSELFQCERVFRVFDIADNI